MQPFIIRKTSLFLTILSLMIVLPLAAQAQEDFQSWLKTLKAEAFSKGISQETVDRALSNITPIQKVIDLDRKQPEKTMSFAAYKQKVVTQDRINKGRQLYEDHKQLLTDISRAYRVQPEYIVALWGIETSYGENTGGFEVIEALATLAYDGRRSGYFRGELMNALRILDQGHIGFEDMRGSWAGAMGQNQFMPSSFLAYAADGDDDGRRNIWTDLPDVFASTANYLAQSGWRDDQKWGREISMPDTLQEKYTGIDNSKFLSEWRNLGVTLRDGSPLPVVEGVKGAIVLPDGINGPAFLVYDNYRVIMKWNKSLYFATSVGLLADRITQ